MKTFAVTIPLTLTVEINAETAQDAMRIVANAFHSDLSNDPLEGVKFAPNSNNPNDLATVKTAEYLPEDVTPLQARLAF